MTELQAHLDKRLAELKKVSGKSNRAASTGQFSNKNIKTALKESGLLTKSGKVRTLTTSQ